MEALEVLAIGPNVIMEDGGLQVGVVVLGQDHLLLAVGAADGRTVVVPPLVHLTGADTLDPGDLVGVFLVRGAQDFTLVGTGGAENPLEVEAGDHVLHPAVAEISTQLRVEGLVAGGEDDSPHLHHHGLRLLVQIDRLGLAGADANLAFPLFEVEAGLRVHVGDQRHCLGEVDVNRLVLGQVLVKRIGDLDRAVVHADVAASALLLGDVAGLLGQRYPEIARLAIDTLHFRIGDDFNIGVPGAFDELRRLDAHGTVVGGEGLVQLGHLAAKGGRFVDQKDPESRIGEVERSLNTADPAADNKYITDISV